MGFLDSYETIERSTFCRKQNQFTPWVKLTSNSSSKTRGAAAPRTRITCAYFLGSEEPSLKLSRLAKLQHTNSSPNSNRRRSKSAIFISRNINSDINSLLWLRVGTHIIYIYIYIVVWLWLTSKEKVCIVFCNCTLF